MADIKNLFEKTKGQKILSNSNINKVGRSVESADYVEQEITFQNKVIPFVDFASASNFAKYGSAEKYYTDSINHITNEWPYDGSEKEKKEWHLSSSYLDRYIFDNLYPRTTGYVQLGDNYGGITPDPDGYDVPGKTEYIRFLGTSNLPTGSTTLREDFNKYNIYNTASQGLYNVELNGNNGYSVEFWFKKNGYSSGNESEKQVFFDLWNSSSANEGRLKIETDLSVSPPVFNIDIKSGSATVSTSVGASIDITGSAWHHYAFTFENTGSSTTSNLYVDGELNDSQTTGDSIGLVTGSMLANIGALLTPYDSLGSANAGKLSGSMDEFRYWKKTRTAEQVGKNWFTQVGGGTNTDITNEATASTKYSYENPVDLGVYYKFNEGIINSASTNTSDAAILDYSGRVSNGSWVGYTVGSRFTGSAMIISSASLSEFEDPIIYSTHPSVSSLLSTKSTEGQEYDYTNNAGIYKSFPAWIIEEDQHKNRNTLHNLSQIIASYFDTLHLQIQNVPNLKDNKYVSGSDKPFPFSNRLINNLGMNTSEIFTNATDLEYLASKDDFRNFAVKLNETKNTIYQNIYNNLSYIYKSKGAEKSFRNLIRCFGIDNELVNINMYGSNVTFELLDNTEFSIVKKRYANFHELENFEATVFQSSSATNSNSRSYLSSSDEMTYRGNTYEAEVHFPKQYGKGSEFYLGSGFVTSSLYGAHTSDTIDSWSSPDVGNFQVQSVRTEEDSKSAYFQLTGTTGTIFPQLTSSVFKDVYDDSRWLFSVKIKPSTYPLADGVIGSDDSPDYDIVFSGYNYNLDILSNSFEVTGTVPFASGSQFMTANKRFFVGAHKTNFTGSLLQSSDVKTTSLRAWMDYLQPDVVKAHAKDVLNFGSTSPNQNAYITQLSKSIGDSVANIPQLETLALHWNFENVTGSDATGQFTVADFTSGSADLVNRWGWLGPISKYQHTGFGDGFPASSTSAIDRRYVHTAQQQLPETLQSGDMVSIIDDTTNQIFSRDSRPIDYNFAFEKSMYRIISQDMLNYFSTIVDFNNLIGAPVNRYRQEYKDMAKFRSLYFERVKNDPDFDRFVEYFKWIDSAIVTMLLQLAPASSRFNDRLMNMVESHVLERSKYWTKFPTLDAKVSDPEAGLRGIAELTYSWKRGHAPLSNLQKDDCLWWSDRAKRQNSAITSGDSDVDADRETIRLSNDFRNGPAPTLAESRDSTATTTTYQGQAYAIRNFTKPYRFVVDESPEIHGGSNFPRAKKVEYTHASLNIGSATQLEIGSVDFAHEKDCDDVIDPNSKERLETKLRNTSDSIGYKSGKSTIFAPFSLFSSSVNTGYASQVSSSFRPNTEIANYHDDSYGDDKGVPVQGPFTNAHVGGREHRHVNFRDQAASTRPEAWNIEITEAWTENTDSFQFGTPGATTGSAIELSDTVFTGSSGFTISMWTKELFKAEVRTMISRADPTNVYATGDWSFILDRNAGGELRWAGKFTTGVKTAQIDTADRIDDGNWHLVVASYDSDSDLMLLNIDNGAVTASQTTSAGVLTALWGTRKFSIGNSYDGVLGDYPDERQWSGSLDEIGLWSEPLTTSDINELWSDGCPNDLDNHTKYGSLESWYRMGDDPSDDATPTTGQITDVEGSNNGTPINTLGDEIVTDAPCTIFNNKFAITSRTIHQPRATMIRDEYAKRALNLRNIKWGTGSYTAGNYRKDYEMIQTSDRNINDRYFVKSDGAVPSASASPYLSGTLEFAMPRFDLTGTNDYIFVERFSAPGGPDVAGGNLDFKSLQFALYNDLNFRNLAVRVPLNEWSTEHCGQFGIKSGSAVRELDYNTSSSYHKVNRNPRHTVGENNSCSVDYDNWWVQHAIPQSVYQYAWVTASVSKSACDTLGYISNFSIPSGTTSTTQSAVPFISSSNWGFPNITDGQDYPVNFVNVLSDLPGTDPSEYKYRLSALQGTLDPDWGITTNLQVTENGAKIKKTTADAWDGSAASNIIISGKGHYQFTTDQTDAYIVTGLNDHPPAVTTGSTHLDVITDMEFAIGLRPIPDGTGNIAIWEDGVNVANFPNITYGIGWSFRIEKDNSTIKYLHDSGSSKWTVFYPSTKPAPLLLGADIAIWNQDASLSNMKVCVKGGNLIAPGPSFVSASGLADSASINAHINNINGPYQYPSWKQTRTGETPVARYHKNNNILSISTKARSNNPRPDTFTNFVEPPVTFKYRPVTTTFGVNDPKVRSTYGNNKGKFSLGINLTQSVNDFLQITDNTGSQVYDTMMAVADLRTSITKNTYSEVVYPREMLTGLAESRGRTSYSEVATVDSDNSASLSNGTNGIDRGPLLRRTFWRDSETLRNRISGSRALQVWDMEIPDLGATGSTPVTAPQQAITTLPNSQGFEDGNATNVYGIGTTPFKTLKTQATASAYVTGNNPPQSASYPAWNIDGDYSSYGDIGELNSHDPYKVAGYLGTAKGSSYWDGTDTGSSSWAAKLTFSPTASAYYYHVQANYSTGSVYRGNMNAPWRVSELSGKSPWFDSYDDYAQDIRVMAKDYSILPEFRISQHMDYYLRNGFSAENNKFLTLDGASITASAEQNTTVAGRNFDTTFFNEYSNSDFQKYFGTFGSSSNPERITLRANAVKKLLPYHGFYPIHRSLQLASMFSQSLGPYVSGEIDNNPGNQEIPATSSNSFDTASLNMQSLLQPYYAPGIMYNTIKSGIATDWAAFTGSFPSGFAGSYPETIPFQDPVNYRVPFESILDPLSLKGVPNTSSNGDGSLYLSYPSWGLAAKDAICGSPAIVTNNYVSTGRTPFVDITNENRANASISPDYTAYSLASNNFWAEIPNFFLENSSLKSIESTKQQYQIQLTESKAYYMDVYCWKGAGTTMFSDGRFFGPNFLFTDDAKNTSPVYSTDASAPTAHTPSYFYGEQILRIKYVATAQDATEFSFQRLFENSTYENLNPGRDLYLTSINDAFTESSPAVQSAMSITSSFNIKSILAEPQIQRDNFGTPRSETNIPNSQRFRWVISPKMETPILDFSDQPVIDSQSARGMWSGYGDIPTTGKGVEFGVRDSFPGNQIDATQTGSLIEACFDNQAPSAKLGVLAGTKQISEAIVAIPYAPSVIQGISDATITVAQTASNCDDARVQVNATAATTPIVGKNFIEIDEEIFRKFQSQYNDYKGSDFASYEQQKQSENGKTLTGVSIRKMIEVMDKYVIPPELDFLTTSDIKPFVMYLFEFNHELKSQDLSDIWQGVMPEISRTAELSDLAIDNNEFSHPTGINEFFGAKKIPDDIRWIVFKVKKKANNNYYAITPQNIGSKQEENATNLTYSYNWPYDYCSLVELAQIEVKSDFGGDGE